MQIKQLHLCHLNCRIHEEEKYSPQQWQSFYTIHPGKDILCRLSCGTVVKWYLHVPGEFYLKTQPENIDYFHCNQVVLYL